MLMGIKLKQHEIELRAMIPELKEVCEKYGWFLGECSDLTYSNGVLRIDTSLIRLANTR